MQKKHEKKVGDASVQEMEGDTVRVILEHARVIPNPRRPRREALPMCTLRGAVDNCTCGSCLFSPSPG
jgi:hypothetical protein